MALSDLMDTLKKYLDLKDRTTHYSAIKIFYQSAPLLAVCILIEIGAGQLLELNRDLSFFALVISLIPLVNGVSGNLGSILGARLSSALHIGTIQPGIKQKELWNNIAVSVFLAALVFLILAALVAFKGMLTSTDFIEMVIVAPLVAILAGMTLTAILIVLSTFVAFISFKRGLDPDNVVVPIVTTTGDVLGIGLTLMYAGVLLS